MDVAEEGVDVLVREAAAGGALEPAGQEGETGLPRGPWDTPPWGHGCGDKSWDTPPHSPHCGCHVTPDLSLGLRGDTSAPPELLAGGEGPPRSPRCHVTALGVTVAGCPLWDPPPPTWNVPQAPSPTPVTGSGVPPGRPCPASTPSPSPTVSASPGSVQEKSGVRRGLRGQGGERRQARATGHRDRLWRTGGAVAQARSSNSGF